MRRLAIAAVLVVAAILLVVLLAPGILLRGSFLREKLQKGPDEFFVDYAWASSPSPGILHVRGLILRDRDRSTEWAFQAEEVTVRFSLLSLLRKRLDVRSVRGNGLTFRARSRPKPGAKGIEARHLPKIPGFGPQPPPKAERPARPKKGSSWTIRVEGIDLPLREIWVNHVRWSGAALLRGRFELEPGRRAQIGPAVVEFTDGAVQDEDVPAVTETKGRVEGTFPSFDVKKFPGNEVFKIVRGRVRFGGKLAGLTFLADAFPGANLRGGRGEVAVDLRLAQGRGEGTLDFASRRIRVKARGREIRGDLDGKLRLNEVDLARPRALLSGSHVNLKQVFVEGSDRTEPWWASLELPEARYAAAPPRLRGHLRGKLRDASPVLALAAGIPEWAVRKLSEHEVAIDLRGSAGAGVLELEEAKATATDFSIEGRYRGRNGEERGIFFVDTGGLLNVGLAVGGEKPGVKILGPRSWYRKALAEWEAAKPR